MMDSWSLPFPFTELTLFYEHLTTAASKCSAECSINYVKFP